MLSLRFLTRLATLAMIVAFLSAGCAAPSYIEVTYKLPDPQRDMGQKSVFLTVVDQRPDPALAGPNAKKDLEHFTGLFSLYVEPEGKEPTLIGAFDLAALFKEALGRRLVSEKVVILPQKTAGMPNIEIQIKEFILDRNGKNWEATLAYKAVTSQEGRVLTSQSVSGNAERLKIVGTREAEKLLGDIFSDMVNRLDPVKLLDHPDL